MPSGPKTRLLGNAMSVVRSVLVNPGGGFTSAWTCRVRTVHASATENRTAFVISGVCLCWVASGAVTVGGPASARPVLNCLTVGFIFLLRCFWLVLREIVSATAPEESRLQN